MIQYNQFFKQYVVRKKQDLVTPKFFPLGDIVLPRESLIHFVSGSGSAFGPSNEQPLIGTYPNKVNIFFDNQYATVLGSPRPTPFNFNEAIKQYRKGHYKYIYARQLPTFLARKDELLVNNLALGPHHYRYPTGRFVFFHKAYNQLKTLVDAVNTRTHDTVRNQYVLIDLPQGIPNYTALIQATDHYRKAFVDGIPEKISSPALLPFIGYGAYWLIDWFFFLNGESEYSLFSQFEAEALERTHFIFTSKGRCWILNLGLLKSWLDELNDKEGKPTSKRVNATKRMLLAMRTLIEDTDEKAQQDQSDETDGTRTGAQESSRLDSVAESQEGGSRSQQAERGRSSLDSDNEEGGDTPTSLSDLFMESQASNRRSDAELGREGERGNTNDSSEVGLSASSGENSEAEERGLDWTSPVDDTLLERSEEVSLDLNKKVIFKKPESGIERALEARARLGNLTVAEQAFFLKQAQRYKTIKMENGETLEEFIKLPEKELRKIDRKVAPVLHTMSDASMAESSVSQLKKNYAGKFLDKDIAGMVLGIQNAGVAITDFKKERFTNLQTSYDIYTVSFHDVNGSPSTRSFRIPVVADDGTYLIDGVKQQLQFQRMEIPIRKINANQVALTSYYDRRLMVTRSEKVEYDYGRWLKKQIAKQSAEGVLEFTLGYNYISGVKVPRVYSVLSKQYSEIKIKGITFNFDLLNFAPTIEAVRLLVDDGLVPVGKKGDEFYLMDEFGNITLGGKTLGTFESLLGINTAKAPVEIATINISGFAFPIGVVLCFYFGIDNLLKVIDAQYRTVLAGDRLNLSEDEYAVTFADETLVFNRRDRKTALIMGGLVKLPNLVNFSRYDLNGPGVWVPVMANPRVKPRQFEEMRLIFDLFIDPITKGELIKRHYPTEMHYLLLEAVEMLTNDDSKHEVEITEQRFVGYERFAGKVYTELAKATRQYRNKGPDRRHTFDLNPEAIMMNIITDASVNQVEEVNPIHEIKEQEAYTFGGTGGRSEDTMVRRTRGQQENYKGVISEAGKDSGKVGFLGYLTSNAKIADYRGNVDIDIKDTQSDLLSVTGQLQYGSTSDDPKRSLYSTVQQSQGVSAVNYQTNFLRTGYETVIAHRTSELYSKPAKQSGEIIKVTPQGMVFKYEDGTEDSFPLGVVIGKAAGELHRHNRVTDFKVGDKFEAGTILGWDEMYFERDFANPTQVSWKCGVMGRIALGETQFTFEDSVEISSEFAKDCKTPYLLSNEFNVPFEEGIDMHVKIGEEVDYDAILCTVIPEHLVGVKESDDFLGISERIGLKQIRSNHHGKIIKIEVEYNGDIESMSDSLKALVKTRNAEIKKLNEITKSGIVDANLAGNSSFAKSSVLPGRVLIRFIVEDLNETETADKFVVGNQMKGTVGNIVSKTFKTVDGRVVDMVFSFKGLFNRMVLSLRDKMAWCEVAIGASKKAAKIYRGK